MKLIILDRDGVINHESRLYIKSPMEWIPIPGALEAIANLTKAGYTIVVATNQSGVGRGYFSITELKSIHDSMCSQIEKTGGKISKIYFCPHKPTENCNCRKPKTGMFEQITKDLNVDLKNINAIFVGDSLRDVELGIITGCKFFLVTSSGSDGQHTLQQLSEEQKNKITIVNNLLDVSDRLIK